MGVIACSRILRPVIGMLDGGWGLLDGMNDAGLAVSLTFGGRFAQAPGFDIAIVLRYLRSHSPAVTRSHQVQPSG